MSYILETIKSNKKEHIDILYDLLLKKKNNISHKENPSYIEHTKFIKNKPYHAWYIIKEKNIIIGSVYLGYDNSIGINLKNPEIDIYKRIIRLIMEKHAPLEAIKSLRNKDFIINLSPDNFILKKALEDIGMKQISTTFLVK